MAERIVFEGELDLEHLNLIKALSAREMYVEELAQIAERDEKIASLEAQVAEAAKNAETAEQLRGEIAELKAQGESDRIDFKLQLAGVRNVKAARALLADHDNDVDKLKCLGQSDCC